MAKKRRRLPRRASSAGHPLLPTLDLHGETADSARRRAESWMRAKRDAGECHVKLVTGRGVHSSGPARLPGAIMDLLGALQDDLVSAYDEAPGGGAFLVELTAPSLSHAPARRPKHLSPSEIELWSRAVEALDDLGVAPTPALVDAEIERLRNEAKRARS